MTNEISHFLSAVDNVGACRGKKDIQDIFASISPPNSFHDYSRSTCYKGMLLEMLKLYFDGLIEKKHKIRDLEEAVHAFDVLMGCTRTAVVNYYREIPIPCKEIYTSLGPFREVYLDYASDRGRKVGRFADKNVRAFARSLNHPASVEKCGIVVAIASGGFEPAIVLAYHFGIDKIFPVRYSRIKCNDTEVKVPLPCDPFQFEDKTVFIVDELSDTGKTKEMVTQWVQQFNPRIISYHAMFDYQPLILLSPVPATMTSTKPL